MSFTEVEVRKTLSEDQVENYSHWLSIMTVKRVMIC